MSAKRIVVTGEIPAATQRLSELCAVYPWPESCALTDTHFERVTIGGLELFMVGLVGTASGKPSVIAAAAEAGGYPVDRAFFELLERQSMHLARSKEREYPLDPDPERVRASLSSGVALHRSWAEACVSATCELIERDRVQRSFRGDFAPVALTLADGRLARDLDALYSLEADSCHPPDADTKLVHAVAGFFLFPRANHHPISYGFAGARNLSEALSSARGEALQRLAFLWGEPLPSVSPEPAPVPDYHQEYYLYAPHHEVLRGWLAGGRRSVDVGARCVFDGEDVAFVDLTPETLRGKVAVAKARSPHACALRFGAPGKDAVPHPIC